MSAVHNDNARWLHRIEDELSNINRQEDINIELEKVRKQLRKMPNWIASGLDVLQGYWLKNFVGCHERSVGQLRICLDSAQMPEWPTVGRTVLIQKVKEEGNVVNNYRPITCLPIVWKLFTGILADEIYNHLENEKLLPMEQKRCRRKYRGTKDQLLINRMIIRNCERKQTGLGIAWIDYKKAYDMVPHPWIKKCLTIFGVAENIKGILNESIEKWCTDLTCRGTN